MNVKITTLKAETEFAIPEGKLELVRMLLWGLCTGVQNSPK